MSAEQKVDLEQQRSQPAPPGPKPYRPRWGIILCIVVQFLVGFGFQTTDYTHYIETETQNEEAERFLQWVVLTNTYAFVAVVVALALPYVRRGSHIMMVLAIGILLAFSAGVLQASASRYEWFAVGRVLAGTACGLVVGMPLIKQAEEEDPLDQVRSKFAFGRIGVYCCSTAIATWMFVSGVSDYYFWDPWRILGCFHALPTVLAFFLFLSFSKSLPRAGDPSTYREDQAKTSEPQQELPKDTHNAGCRARPFRNITAHLCTFLFSFSTMWKFRQVLGLEIEIFGVNTMGYLVRSALCLVTFMCFSALTIPLISKTGDAGMFFVMFAGQLVAVTPLRLLDSEFLLERSSLPFAVEVFILISSAIAGFGAGMIWLVIVKINSHVVDLKGLYAATAIVITTYSGLIFAAWYVEFLRGWPSVLVLANVIAALIIFMFPSSFGSIRSSRGDTALESGKTEEAVLDGVAVDRCEQTS